MLKRLCALFLLFIPLLSVANPPLPAEKAFNLQVATIDPNTIKVSWQIAPKYFLYKNCLQIINKDKEVLQIGQINYPLPQNKTNRQGQTFPIYHNKLSLNIPILSENPGESLIELRYQGCSNEGFCYPPERKLIKISFRPDLSISAVNIEAIQLSKPLKPVKRSEPVENIQEELTTDFAELFSNNNWVIIILSFLGFGVLLSFTPCILPMVPVLSGIIVGHGEKISTRKAFLLSLS